MSNHFLLILKARPSFAFLLGAPNFLVVRRERAASLYGLNNGVFENVQLSVRFASHHTKASVCVGNKSHGWLYVMS